MTIQKSIQETETIANAMIPIGEFRSAARRMREQTPRWFTAPVLGYVMLSLDQGRVTMQATDLDSWLSITMDADVTGSGSTMVKATTLTALAAAANGPISVEIGGDGIVTLREGDLTIRQRAIIKTDDFPPPIWPVDGTATTRWTQSQDSLRRMLGQLRHCISGEETRYYLNGVFLTQNPDTGNLRAIATDGHRLGRMDTDIPVTFQPPKIGDSGKPVAAHPGVIMPTPIVKLLLRLTASGRNDPVQIEVYGLKMRICIGLITITAHMIDGSYPDYMRVIPPVSQNVTCTLTNHQISRLAAVAAGVYGPHFSIAAKFCPTNGTISTRENEDGDVSVPAVFDVADGVNAEPFCINVRYLRDQARATPVVKLHWTRKGDPILILTEDPDATFVIMPMLV